MKRYLDLKVRLRSANKMDRYPDLFKECANKFGDNLNILSFGCGYGEECFSLRKYFPNSKIVGADISRKAIDIAKKKNKDDHIVFVESNLENIISSSPYNIIFALNVFKRLRLSRDELNKAYPLDVFENQLKELVGFLKDDGALVMKGTSHNFDDTEISKKFYCLHFDGYRRNSKSPNDSVYVNRDKYQPRRDVTIISALTPSYEKKLRLTIPTWKMKPQFSDLPVLIFTNGYDNPDKQLSYLKKYFDIKFVKWDMDGVDSIRDKMLSSFILGASKHLKTDFSVKIDADTGFINSRDIFDPSDFDYDIVGHRWGYTRPASWIIDLENWYKEKFGKENIFSYKQNVDFEKKRAIFPCKRLASFVCLQSTDFLKEISSYVDGKLPCPSHDTFAWYMAKRLEHRSWGRKNIKKLGAVNRSNYKKLNSVLYG